MLKVFCNLWDLTNFTIVVTLDYGGLLFLRYLLIFLLKPLLLGLLEAFYFFIDFFFCFELVWKFSFCDIFYISVCAYSLWKLKSSRGMIILFSVHYLLDVIEGCVLCVSCWLFSPLCYKCCFLCCDFIANQATDTSDRTLLVTLPCF
jgi:hypothetical protein